MTATFTVTPGPNAMSGMVLIGSENPALVIALDPVTVSVNVPDTEDGRYILARFCGELALEAGKVAAFLGRDLPRAGDWRF